MNKNFDGNNDILLIGAGGHAKVIIEIIKMSYKNYNIIGITDKNEDKIGDEVLGVPIIGTDKILQELKDKGLNKAFISLGMVKDFNPRLHLYNMVKRLGLQLINIIHSNSILSEHLIMGQGIAILAGAIINTDVVINDNCIINTGSIIEHDCIIGCNVHIAPGVKISGQTNIGDNCMIGIGSTIIQGLQIGENSIIGAGSVVTKDIPPNSIAVGVPAKVIKTNILKSENYVS